MVNFSCYIEKNNSLKGNKMLENKKVIIFDMDGTLIDSVGIWNEVDRILIKQLCNLDVDENEIVRQRENVLKSAKTNDIYVEYCEYLSKKYKINNTPEEILELRLKISDYYINNVVDYKPGAEKVLHKLKDEGYILAIATTTMNRQIDSYKNINKNIINKANINTFFTLIITKEDVLCKKPNPEIHFKIMNALNVKPEECIVVEDSLMGVEAAHNAGIDVISMYDRYSDQDRDKINEISNFNFSNWDEFLNCLLEKYTTN